MSEDKFIEVEVNTLGFEECINKNILFRNMPTVGGDASKSTENESFEETETLIGLENKSSSNSSQDTCTVAKSQDDTLTDNQYILEEIKPLRFNSEIISTLANPEITNNLYNKEENIEKVKNSTEKDLNNNISNIGVISINSESSLIYEVKVEILNTVPPESLDSDYFNEHNELENDSDGSGYHSSDFEFINENEATLEGLIKNNHYNKVQGISNFTSGLVPKYLNCNSTCNSNPDESKSFEIPRKKYQARAPSRMNLSQSNSICSNEGNKILGDSLGHGPGPSYSNLNNHGYRRDPHGSGPSSSNNSQNDHPMHNAVPIGEEYFDLFRGMYDPALLCNIHIMENKSFRTTSMNVEFEGLGFDMRLMRDMDGSSQDEFETEAGENVKKILQMYPADNRKRRRRH